jgi:hypothetical protein
MPYFKTTVVIFSEYDPAGNVEIDRLASDAMSGDSICTEQRTETVSPNALSDEAASFFGVE